MRGNGLRRCGVANVTHQQETTADPDEESDWLRVPWDILMISFYSSDVTSILPCVHEQPALPCFQPPFRSSALPPHGVHSYNSCRDISSKQQQEVFEGRHPAFLG